MNAETMSLQEKLDHLKKEIQKMQRDITHGHKKPHKLVMLLAVLDLFEKHIISENKIYFNDDLTESFSNVFNLIRAKGDWNQPAPPFFHLRTSSFWKHKIKDGQEVQYSKLSTSGGGTKRIEENIDYAYLTDSAYEVFSNKEARQNIRELITTILNPLSNFEDSAPIR
ncbi:MAG: hypothetical protein Q8L64_02020 [bacterium]|jgi:predicted restriction endonuclease|nr:hypothetical protein [bacterium]